MQGIIDTEFRNCTVLAIVHRLKHVSRYDQVVVLHDGVVVEAGEPDLLIAGDTEFAKMYALYA